MLDKGDVNLKCNQEKKSIVVSEEFDSTRLDSFISNSFDEISRNSIQKMIKDGNVQINDEVVVQKKYLVKKDDIINIIFPEVKDINIVAENIELDIVYEDEDVLVVNKPIGMVVHPAVSNYSGTLVNGIMYHCKDSLSGINGELRPGIVHRIDKDTSGLLMVAKNDFTHNHLAEQLKNHTVTRKYLAIVNNAFKEEQGRIDKPIGRAKNNRLKQAIDYQSGKRAITNWKLVENFGRYALIECSLETGRTHQIRVHMSSINHSLLGDGVYGSSKNEFKVEGQQLHAKTLGFIHPRTLKYMEFNVEPPENFKKIIAKLKERNR